VRVTVAGRVQGVFFRASCADEARRLGLGGWVRNRPDGAVEAAFEGDDAAVGEMLAWCRHGPPLAQVQHVDEVAEQPRGEREFRVTS
jgi:acylphosphatase